MVVTVVTVTSGGTVMIGCAPMRESAKTDPRTALPADELVRVQ